MNQSDPKSLGVLVDTRLPVNDRKIFMFALNRMETWLPISDTGLWSTKVDPLVDDWRTAFRGEQES